MIYNLEDTICAQSTPAGRGGIHVIRVSGQQSVQYVQKVCPQFANVKVPNSHQVYYGFIIDPASGNSVDEVLLTYFKKGRSFTSEDTVEISCHGNPLIVKEILALLISAGCRMAERGEFTYRAYKGGRLSLTQAEAILSLIESNTKKGISKSLDLLSGDSLSYLQTIEDQLIWIVSRLEARIDFSTEDIEIESNEIMASKFTSLISTLKSTLDNFNKQNIIEKGLKTVIVGPPNAGKSSLFNHLMGSDRSIVSHQPGTTRDFLTETIHIQGHPIQIIDTAGLRSAGGEIEKLGMQKVKDLVVLADLVIILMAADQLDFSFIAKLEGQLESKRVMFVVNKLDLNQTLNKSSLLELSSSQALEPFIKGLDLQTMFENSLFISIYNNIGLDLLTDQIVSQVESFENYDSFEVLNLRHAKAIDKALDEIRQAYSTFKEGLGDEFVLSHLNKALKLLVSIASENNDEIVRDRIFKDFCLGK